MSINRWVNPANTEVAQVRTFTITAASSGMTAVWTLTVTMDDGSTTTITYTEDGSPTTTEIATGLYNAWLAGTHPEVLRITAANPSAGVLTLTANTAGRPFSVALADDGDGTHTESNTTENVGNNDYGTARNWSLNAVPVATDDVVVPGAEDGNSVAILYGLNQSSVAIDEFNVQKDYNGQIGRIEDGKSYYLRIDPDSVDYQGSSNLALIDIGSANISPQVECNGNALTSKFALYVKGSNIATLEVRKGKVGIAPLTGETATVATLLVSYVANAQSDSDVTVGSGVTLTTLTQSGGKCELRCAATTVTTAADATTRTEGSGAITTWNLYGKGFPHSTGTITTMNVWGVSDESGDRSARTISTLVEKPGGSLKHVAAVTHSATTQLADPGTFTRTLVG